VLFVTGKPSIKLWVFWRLYLDQTVYRFLGISTGIEYSKGSSAYPATYRVITTPPGDVFFELFQKTFIHSLNIPLNITLMMNEKPNAKCLFFCTIGYSLGDTFEQESTISNYDQRTFLKTSKGTLVNTFRMGLEARYNPKPKINLALEAVLK
jgi:hypothetical protein